VHRPLISLACGWLIGEWLANQVSDVVYWWIAIFIVLSGCLFYAKYNKGIPVILLLVGFSTGATYFQSYNESNTSSLTHGMIVHGIGEVVSKPYVDGDHIRFDLKLQSIQNQGYRKQVPDEIIKITTKAKNPKERSLVRNWYSSCLIKLPLKLERPPQAKNPGGFNYALYLHRYGIHWQSTESMLSQVQVITCQRTFSAKIDKLRQTLQDRLEELYPEPFSGILKAMLIGEQQALDMPTQEIFSTLGLIHVLSISGLHVSLFVAMLYFLLLLCGMTREKSALLIIVFLPFYAILTGGSSPVIRSVIMASMMLLAVILRKTSDSVSFLALAFLVQLIWNPYQLWEAGFQLSFLITLGLVFYVEPLAHHIPVPWHRFRQALSVMIVSQVLSFPIVAVYFYQYSWLSAPVNLIFVPIYSVVILPLSTISLLISFLSIGWGKIFADFTSWIMSFIDNSLSWISSFPQSTYSLSPPSLWWVLCYLLLLWFTFITIVSDRRLVRQLRYVTLSVLVLMFGIVLHKGETPTTLITMVDVGQGDALLVETAQGKVFLIDGGGTLPRGQEKWQERRRAFEVGRDVLVPYLRFRGINHIDTMVMTHGDGDHIRGLRAVAKRLSVGQVLHSAAFPADDFEKNLLSSLEKKKVPIKLVRSGDAWQVEDGIQVKILHPDFSVPSSNINNGSIVMLLSIYNTNILLTGDMEEEAEREVLAKYHFPSIQILKVAHHGSNTSTTDAWISHIKPHQALISAGLHNRYGHPKPEVLTRLRQAGARIWRTDQHGAILIRVWPDGYQIESNSNRKGVDQTSDR
jgi:competence protein ComEC